jgi:hypothetical protein
VGRRIVCRCPIGVECDHAIGCVILKLAPFQFDLEAAEIDAFQFDGFGHGTQPFFAQVDLTFIEFPVNRLQIFE